MLILTMTLKTITNQVKLTNPKLKNIPSLQWTNRQVSSLSKGLLFFDCLLNDFS